MSLFRRNLIEDLVEREIPFPETAILFFQKVLGTIALIKVQYRSPGLYSVFFYNIKLQIDHIEDYFLYRSNITNLERKKLEKT